METTKDKLKLFLIYQLYVHPLQRILAIASRIRMFLLHKYLLRIMRAVSVMMMVVVLDASEQIKNLCEVVIMSFCVLNELLQLVFKVSNMLFVFSAMTQQIIMDWNTVDVQMSIFFTLKFRRMSVLECLSKLLKKF